MRYFIKIKDGLPFEHPIAEDNFVQVFPNVDLKFLPADFARVETVPAPNPGPFHYVSDVSYAWDNGVVKQVWTISPKSDEEIAALRATKTENALLFYRDHKAWAISQRQEFTDAETLQAWDVYISQLDAWTLVDPFEPNFPIPPRIGSDGKLMDINSPGSAPNVIG